MKRNTPLITLLTGAALGVALLIASMLQTPVKAPAGYSSTVSPSSASASTPAPAAPASSSAPAPASASASPTATPYAAAPAKATYAGKAKSGGATISIVVYDGQVIAYVCNGSTIDEWFSGPISNDNSKVTLSGKNNATLTAAYGVGEMTGDVTAHGTNFDFGVNTVSKSSGAGLYRATAKVGGQTVKAGWIVLDDGTQIGSIEADSTAAAPSAATAPRLDLTTRTATYKGTVLHAIPVSSATGSGF